MTPEELAAQLTTALGERLCSVVLYGSAAAGDFVAGTSNYNILLVLDRLGLTELDALSKPARQWAKAGNRPPLLFTRRQLTASADTFPIELSDMQQSHRVLFGEDPLAGVTVEQEHLRLQLERELKSHLLALRERYLLTGGNRRRVAELLTSSVAGFLVLFRATLRLFQKDVPRLKLEAIERLAAHIPFDPRPFREIDDLKHRRRKLRELDPQALFEAYLTTIELLADAVDRHIHSQTGDKLP